MQKKIIALAIASAMTVPALAYAEATVYGQANLSIDMVNNGAAASVSNNQLNSNQSRVGVKGSEDLGGGLSAVWQMEAAVAMDESVSSAFDRNTFLGVKSNDMGTVLVGRHDTPYKISTRKLDVFADSAADNRDSLNGLMSVHDLRLANVLAYISPAFGGLTVAAATVFGAEDSTATTDKKGSALSLAGMYSMDAIYATLAYQTVTVGTAGKGDMGAPVIAGSGLLVDDKISAFKLGGGYTMDAITVNAVFESTTIDTIASADNTTNTNLYLGAKFGISSTDAVKAAFTKRGASKAGSVTATDDATQIAVGYDHDMSKSTSVYALYVKTTTNSAVNVNPSILSFGMKHAF